MTRMNLREMGEWAADLKLWRWKPRMLAVHPPSPNIATWLTVLEVSGEWLLYNSHRGVERIKAARCYPDLTDAATLGCLMARVQEVYQGRVLIAQGCGWWLVQTDHGEWGDATTGSLTEALLFALEAAVQLKETS